MTTTLAPTAALPDAEPPADRGPTVPDVLVLGLALLLPVAYVPGLASPFWAPKAALLLVATVPGLLLLGRAACRRDRAAIAAVAFLAACGLSSLLADDPVASLTGLHDADGGLLFVAAGVAAWALAREATEPARRLLPGALLVGIGITSAVAWLQMTVGLPGDALAPWRGARAAGLQGNPVFLGALASAAICLGVAWRPLRSRVWLGSALLVLYAGALQLSGSRVGLLPVVVALGWVLVRRGWKVALVLVAATAVGIGGAQVVATSDASTTARAAESSADLSTRLDIWRVGADAFVDAPVLGAGPGRFRAVASPRWTLELAQAHGPDVLLLDAHNVLVEYLVTVGLVGVGLAALWLVLALRRARGPLLGFAAALAVSWLVQPQGVDTTPLLLIALGASVATAPADVDAAITTRAWRSALALALLPGLVAGGWLLAGERQLYLGERGSQAALDRADRMIGVFPVVAATRTERAVVLGLAGDRAARRRAIALARAAARQEPTRPDWWNRLGEVEGQWGSPRRARIAFERALELNPWSARALTGLFLLARDRGDADATARLRARLCALGPTTCPARG